MFITAKSTNVVQILTLSIGPKKWRRDSDDLAKWEAVNHNMTGLVDFTSETPESSVFGGNTSAILSPTITDGPYYVWGEVQRSNVKEDEYCDGVDVYLEVQYIDVNTCQPIPGAFVDIWNANATGVYRSVCSQATIHEYMSLTSNIVVSLLPATTLRTAGIALTCVVFRNLIKTVL